MNVQCRYMPHHLVQAHININKTKILAILFMPFGFIAPKTLNYFAFQSFDFENT